MSSSEDRVNKKRTRSASRSPRRHKHKDDRKKRHGNKHEERELVMFDPHKRIKQEPVSPPRHSRWSPNTRDSSPQRDRSRFGRDQPHSRRSRFQDADDSSRRDGYRHFDSRRPIKREPDDGQDHAQRRERERNDERRRQARLDREENNENIRGSGGSGAGGDDQSWGREATGAKPAEKEKPNFELSGKLAEDTNMFRGVVIKYNEPPEARLPKRHWRLYPFKGDEGLPVLHMHRQSAYLIGRNRLIADLPVDHPSCSQQHAVFQYRLVSFTRDDGSASRRVAPYIIDLNSTNGTFLNNKQIEPQKYVELREKDVLKFGFSSREYVLLHDAADTGEVVNEDES